MKRLAGRRRAIGETFVEEKTGYWGPRWRDTRIEHWSLQSGQDWNRWHPRRSVTIQMLARRLCRAGLGRRCLGKCKAEGTSGQTNIQSTDRQDNHEDTPARRLVTPESQVL